jgi:hypothetical protein
MTGEIATGRERGRDWNTSSADTVPLAEQAHAGINNVVAFAMQEIDGHTIVCLLMNETSGADELVP